MRSSSVLPLPAVPPGRHALLAVAALGPVLAVLLLGQLATVPNLDWYEALNQPSFRPPNWLFGPVWTVLYLLMAWAFYRVLRRPAWMPDRTGAIRAYLLQLGLNALWSFAFFAAHSPALGLAVVLALFVAIVVTGRRFAAVDRAAALCFVPYGLWVAFAALLNLSILIRN